MKTNNVCVKCGETREAIKKHKLICGSVSWEGELIDEFGRHRFKPWTEKELAEFDKADKYWESLGKQFDKLHQL